jgi:hypothetical protein
LTAYTDANAKTTKPARAEASVISGLHNSSTGETETGLPPPTDIVYPELVEEHDKDCPELVTGGHCAAIAAYTATAEL